MYLRCRIDRMTRATSAIVVTLWAFAGAPVAYAQLAVGEISGTWGSAQTPFHGYVALLNMQPFQFTPIVRHPSGCGTSPGFANLVTTSDWGDSVGAYLAINGSFSLPENGYKPGDCLQMIGPIK